jgi:tetratricopeptide (TPR) repeat protein
VPLPGRNGGAAVPLPSQVNAAVPLPSGETDFARGEELGDGLEFGEEPPPPPAPSRPPPAATPDDPFALDFDAPSAGPAPTAVTASPLAQPAPALDPFAVDLDAVGSTGSAPAPGGGTAASPMGDDMEFDPTAPAKSKGDDLEADLDAPAPAAPQPTQSVDDLELLDFIDEAAAAAKGKIRQRKEKFDGFQVRSKQGKISGPLGEAQITKMLSDGKLLGNEDISQDGEKWVALGTHPVFAEALQSLMEAPAAMPQVDSAAQQAAMDPNERIKQIYGGRMAGINIVDSQATVDAIRKRIPLIAAGAVGAIVFAFGLYLSFTPYGPFGYKYFFPKVIKPGSPLYQKIVAARTDLDVGSFGSLQAARAAADETLNVNVQFLEGRAIYAEATFALKERYGLSDANQLARAHKFVSDLWVTNANRPEVVEARAAEQLLLDSAAPLRPALEKALATTSDQSDPAGLALLLARSYALDKDDPKTKLYFEKADGLGKNHVLALTSHAAWLARTKHDYAGAAALLEKAVKEQPAYPPAALDLATLRMGPLAQPESVKDLLKPLADAKRDELSQEEQARVHALLGMADVYEKKTADAEAEFKQAQTLAPNSPAVEGAYASYLLRRGDFSQAEPLFEKAYQQRSDDLDVLDGLVAAQLGQGRYLDASKLVTEALARMGPLPRLQYLQGRVADSADKVDDAEKSYKAAIAADPKLVEADLALGRFYLKHRAVKEAKEVLDVALKKAPLNPAIQTEVAEVALAEGRVDDAQAGFEQALKLDADAPISHMGLAQVLLLKGKLPEAHTEADVSLKQDEKLAGAHRVLGEILQAEKDNPNAKIHLKTAVDQDPKDAEGMQHLGEVLYALGDYEGAQAQLENSLTIRAADNETFFYLALCHFHKREPTQAIENMQRALQYGGEKNAEYRYNFGLIYHSADGHYADAITELKTAIQLKPDYADALETLGDLLLDNNDVNGAIDNFKKALAVDSGRVELLSKIGEALFKAGREADSIPYFQQHLQADPKAVAEYAKIGLAYDDINQKEKAIEAYRKAVEVDPTNAQAWRSLGYEYKDRNKRTDATAAFKKYLALSPNADDKAAIEDELDGLKMK